jgi:hypothetical protein
VLRGHHHDHHVGDAGDGQRDEGRVDDRDQQDTDETEGEREVDELVGVTRRGQCDGEGASGGPGDFGPDCCE